MNNAITEKTNCQLSRRSFLALSAAAPFALRYPLAPAAKTLPIGIELYSVRNALKQDLTGTVRAVAQMGYQCVEFFSPYYQWSEAQARDMRKLMDDLGIRCYSTHNDAANLKKENIEKTRALNTILGCKYVVVASANPAELARSGGRNAGPNAAMTGGTTGAASAATNGTTNAATNGATAAANGAATTAVKDAVNDPAKAAASGTANAAVSGSVNGAAADWSLVADLLNAGDELLAPSGLKVGYHNHEKEFTPVDGKRPIETIAAKTKKSVMLQLDVGTCIQAGSDPVAWIKQNPGRIHSLHLKDWSPEPDKGFKVLFSEGTANWKEIFAAAESVGGAEYYLMEQEGSRLSEMETAKACLDAYKKVRA
jgi:sugar phosphate isomerase/epimerase